MDNNTKIIKFYLSQKNTADSLRVVDYLIELEKNGNINKEDVPRLYGDGSRWGTLTKKGFVSVYEAYVEAKTEVNQSS
jgi:hypothetical protein